MPLFFMNGKALKAEQVRRPASDLTYPTLSGKKARDQQPGYVLIVVAFFFPGRLFNR
jgi:hypothetical protein